MNTKGKGTLTVYGLGSRITDTDQQTDLDNHRISLSVTDGAGRRAHLEASLIQYYGPEITDWHPYGLTGMVVDAHYGRDTASWIHRFRPVPIPGGRGRRKNSPSSLFPYNRAGLLEMVNREFGTHFDKVRLVPAYK